MLRPTWFSSLSVGDVTWRHLYKKNEKLFILDQPGTPPYFDLYPLVKVSKEFLISSQHLIQGRVYDNHRTYNEDNVINVLEMKDTPTNTGNWIWTCTCMQELLSTILSLQPLEICDLILNYLYAATIPLDGVFADFTSRVWMPLCKLEHVSSQPPLAQLTWTSKRPQLLCGKTLEIQWKQHLIVDRETRMDLCEVHVITVN